MQIDENSVREQSLRAYNQWCVQWREQAKDNGKHAQLPLTNLEYSGIGKVALLLANGYTYEQNLETILKYKDNVDVVVCDKTLQSAIKHGLKPKYCIVCDANVNYEKYMESVKDELQDTTLLMNVCGNPKWADNGNWKEKYFFLNQDIIKSELEFANLSGCRNFIPAGTNVSNAMVVMLFQSNNEGYRNFFGYDKTLLIGFDYCWSTEGNYYAFDNYAGGKHNYMRHMYTKAVDGKMVYTSTNLQFSAAWLKKYIENFRLPVVQCGKKTILAIPFMGDLRWHMKYKGNPEDGPLFKSLIEKKKKLVHDLKATDVEIYAVHKAHTEAFLKSL